MLAHMQGNPIRCCAHEKGTLKVEQLRLEQPPLRRHFLSQQYVARCSSFDMTSNLLTTFTLPKKLTSFMPLIQLLKY